MTDLDRIYRGIGAMPELAHDPFLRQAVATDLVRGMGNELSDRVACLFVMIRAMSRERQRLTAQLVAAHEKAAAPFAVPPPSPN